MLKFHINPHGQLPIIFYCKESAQFFKFFVSLIEVMGMREHVEKNFRPITRNFNRVVRTVDVFNKTVNIEAFSLKTVDFSLENLPAYGPNFAWPQDRSSSQ